MPAAERRARRAAHRRLLGCDGLSRAERFRLRLEGGEVPSFDLIAAPPAWRVADEDGRRELALVAALLHYRETIDAELHGPALARLAALVGEELFDAVCEAELGGLPQADDAGGLPAADELERIGYQLLELAAREPSYAVLATSAAELIAITATEQRQEAA